MTQLILARHGETDWDKEKRIQGALDIPLNEKGALEAKQISASLSKFKISAVYSSPVPCSYETACEISAPHKIKPKRVNELRELNCGVWQGLLLSNIKKRYKKQYNIWKTSPVSGRPPKGESVGIAYDRAVSYMHKIVDKHKGESICLVSGNMILALIKCYLLNLDPDKIWEFIPKKTWWEAFEI